MSDPAEITMRADDFPLDLVSLQLDDYDVVQQHANEQLKSQMSHRQHVPLAGGDHPADELLAASLLHNSDLLLHSHISHIGQFESFHHLNGANAFGSLTVDTTCEDVAMDIQQFPTPTGSPVPIAMAACGYATPLTISPVSTPSTTPGTTPYNTPGHTPAVTPGHTPGVTPGSSPPGPSPLPSPCGSHPSSPRGHKGHMLMMRGLTSAPYVTVTSSSGSSKDSKSVKIPRHKRPSHINAEQRRRSKIQQGFDELSSMIPAISEICQNGNKDSKAAMLSKTVDYCRQLRSEYKELANEADLIRKEIEVFTGEIKQYQNQLPAAGIAVNQKKSSSSSKSTTRGEELFEEYLKGQTRVNWKFWIFGLVIRPLFESYNTTVTTATTDEFTSSVLSWLEDHCSLVKLRPAVFNALRHMSTATSVMDTPDRLPGEASMAAAAVTPKTEPKTSVSSSPQSASSPGPDSPNTPPS